MAELYPPEVVDELNRIGERYLHQLNREVLILLRQVRAGGYLYSNIKPYFIKATPDRIGEIGVKYPIYGDYIGKRRLQWTRIPPPEAMLEYIQKKGIQPTVVPGYAPGVIPGISIEKQQKRLAWAIAQDKRINDTHKPFKWKKKALPKLLGQLNFEIINAYARTVEEVLARSISNEENN
jgi:hypothetical protein